MEDTQVDGTEQVDQFDGADYADATGPEDNSAGGFNPAWEPIKEKLGDAAFQLIQPELSQWDQGVNKRFETISSQYAPYKDLGSPEELANYKQIIEQMDSNPEAIYEALGTFLEENGRMPSKQEAQELADDIDEYGEDPSYDPRIDQLAQGQEQIREFLEYQQEMEVQAQAEYELADEMNAIQQERGYSQEDMAEVIRQAAFLSSQSDNIVPLSVAADQFDALRERILTTPRPGDSAPRLLPTSGGTPSSAMNKSMGELSRNETQDLIAAFLNESNKS